MNGLDRALSLLREGSYTCILCRGELLLTSQKRGILPLLELWEETKLKDASVADRIIGKAAALLLILGGAKAAYGEVMSENAYRLLTEAGLEVQYGSLVPYIVNRKEDGMCPMEQAVAGLSDPKEAPAALYAALKRLKAQAPL